jgi:hypothetical protein
VTELYEQVLELQAEPCDQNSVISLSSSLIRSCGVLVRLRSGVQLQTLLTNCALEDQIVCFVCLLNQHDQDFHSFVLCPVVFAAHGADALVYLLASDQQPVVLKRALMAFTNLLRPVLAFV